MPVVIGRVTVHQVCEKVYTSETEKEEGMYAASTPLKRSSSRWPFKVPKGTTFSSWQPQRQQRAFWDDKREAHRVTMPVAVVCVHVRFTAATPLGNRRDSVSCRGNRSRILNPVEATVSICSNSPDKQAFSWESTLHQLTHTHTHTHIHIYISECYGVSDGTRDFLPRTCISRTYDRRQNGGLDCIYRQ